MSETYTPKAEKSTLACWLYEEDGYIFYCVDCIDKRIEEATQNREFSESIDYDDGDELGYFCDIADKAGSCCALCGFELQSVEEEENE